MSSPVVSLSLPYQTTPIVPGTALVVIHGKTAVFVCDPSLTRIAELQLFPLSFENRMKTL